MERAPVTLSNRRASLAHPDAAGEVGAAYRLRTNIVWNDEIDMAAETLWRLTQEQSGATMSPAAFKQWRERKAYTLDTAARALGVSRRMVAYYEQGAKPIPRVVALAADSDEAARL
jgi:DNA-binding transcriptional regulator YiaG